MSHRRLTLVALPLTVVWVACAHPAPRAKSDADVVIAAPGSDPVVRDQDIAFYQKRLLEDPESAADRSRLALLFLARSREAGNFADVQRAESLAIESLHLRESHNSGTFTILASARLASHDFRGALDAARRLVATDPTSPTSRALLGEILLEIGQYDEARTIFTSLEANTRQLSVASRLARWYELTGRIDQARSVARYAARLARTDGGLTREQIAWFHLRLGDLALKSGDLHGADSAYTLGLTIFAGDYRIEAAQARLASARGDWRSAIAFGEQAIAVQLDPGTLGIMADAWMALGDTAQSASYARAMTVSALKPPGPIHRAWGLFLIDHGQRTDDVLRRVRKEQITRKDVYGDDLLAWTLHARGDDRGAWRAMQRALSQGTEDAQIAYHAAEIARALGNIPEAERQAGRVLAFNPHYRSYRSAGSAVMAHAAPTLSNTGR